MPKADANIRVGADATAFFQNHGWIGKRDSEKNGEIGQVFMGALGIKAAAQSIASAFSAFTVPAKSADLLGDAALCSGGNVFSGATLRLAFSWDNGNHGGMWGNDKAHGVFFQLGRELLGYSSIPMSNAFLDILLITFWLKICVILFYQNGYPYLYYRIKTAYYKIKSVFKKKYRRCGLALPPVGKQRGALLTYLIQGIPLYTRTPYFPCLPYAPLPQSIMAS